MGWFYSIVSFEPDSFRDRFLSAWLCPPGPLSSLAELENIEDTQLRLY